MSYTPFMAPFLSGLFGDKEVAEQFSISADMKAMLRFETALAKAQAKHGIIPNEAAETIENAIEHFEPIMPKLALNTPQDGLVVPELIRQLRSHIGEPYQEYIHYGSTSQDVIDTSLILRLSEIIKIFEERLNSVTASLNKLDETFGSNPLMARTRMQAALPASVSDRIAIWQNPNESNKKRLQNLKQAVLKLQLAGPIGKLEKLEDKGQAIRDEVANILNLNSTTKSWHTDRSALSEFVHWMMLVTGSLGKIGQDITLMAQQGIDEVAIEGGGGSSAMAHKKNPIKAEALVTLAKFTNIQASGFGQSIVHEQERSGVNWSLEWLLMPQICVAAGASMRVTNELLSSVSNMGNAK